MPRQVEMPAAKTLLRQLALAALVVATSSCVDELPTGSKADRESREQRPSGLLTNSPELLADMPALRVADRPSSALGDAELVAAVSASKGRVFVGLKPRGARRSLETGIVPGLNRAEALALRDSLRARGVAITQTFAYNTAVVAQVSPTLAEELRRLPYVDYVLPIVPGSTQGTSVSQDTSWGTKKIGAPAVWAGTFGTARRGEGVSVTILDTGLDPTHLQKFGDGPTASSVECLVTSVSAPGAQAESCQASGTGHGSFVAGIIAARDNSTGVVGIATGLSHFTSIRVCTSESDCDVPRMIAALDWVIASGRPRHIVNISIGSCYYWPPFAYAISYAASHGILIVAAAGNAHSNLQTCSAAPVPEINRTEVMWPARFPEVIAVSGTLPDDSFAEPLPAPSTGGGGCNPRIQDCEPNPCPVWDPDCSGASLIGPEPTRKQGSRYGPEVDISAPYTAYSLEANGGYGWREGTSFASPVVAATAALVWSQYPGWTANQVRGRLLASAVPLGTPTKFGAGRVNALAAVHPPLQVGMFGPTVVTTPGNHTYSAYVAGGNGVYAYEWSLAPSWDGPFSKIGTASSVQVPVFADSPYTRVLRLRVTSDGRHGYDAIQIINETNNPCAPYVCLVGSEKPER